MFNLRQESPSPLEPSKNVTRIKDVSVREILQERREAIERGKLKGRRLFQSTTFEGESSHREERSMSFCNSDDESNESEGVHGYCTRDELCSLSSSSSSCLVGDDDNDNKDNDNKVMDKLIHCMATAEDSASATYRNRRTRYAVLLGGVTVILIMIAMFMCLAKNLGGDDCDMILVPT